MTDEKQSSGDDDVPSSSHDEDSSPAVSELVHSPYSWPPADSELINLPSFDLEEESLPSPSSE